MIERAYGDKDAHLASAAENQILQAAEFVAWYNTQHLHSAISFVSPADRHGGRDLLLLERRRQVYERARSKHPERWSGSTRSWEHVDTVRLNPQRETNVAIDVDEAAA
jgi:putative transposase